MEVDDVYYWKKHGRPSAEKDHVRNSIAECSLAHLKTEATVLKSIHCDPEAEPSFKADEDVDLAPFLIYSLNKKRRWEAEENIGVELLDRIRNLNEGWKVMVAERVNLRTYIWPLWSYGSQPERYGDFFMIRKVHKIEDGYEESELKSIWGQRFSHFLKENRMPKKEDKEKIHKTPQEPMVVYNFLRAPANYFPLLQKPFQGSNYGWDWPHPCYWRRVERLQEVYKELRYGEVEREEDSSYFSDFDEDDEDYEQEPKSQFYNLEDHIVDKFVMVKRRRNR